MNQYKYFLIPTSFEKDRWVKNVLFFEKSKVIHHVVLFIMDESFSIPKEEINSVSARTKVKGILSSTERYAKKDIGYRLAKNSKIILEIHYESIGQEVIDNWTHIKINFYKEKPKYQTLMYALATKKINIPAYHSNYKTKVSHKVEKEMTLFSISPHMHLRGKASSLFVISPEGIRKKIFSVDPYLYNFQKDYILRESLKITKGSTLECKNWFDNSLSNPSNPDPTKNVFWGNMSDDEMSICFLTFLIPSDDLINDAHPWVEPK